MFLLLVLLFLEIYLVHQRNATMETSMAQIPLPIKCFFSSSFFHIHFNNSISILFLKPPQSRSNAKSMLLVGCFQSSAVLFEGMLKKYLMSFDFGAKKGRKKSFNNIFYGTSTTCSSIKFNAFNIAKILKIFRLQKVFPRANFELEN
jgi:hypothetical protein